MQRVKEWLKPGIAALLRHGERTLMLPRAHRGPHRPIFIIAPPRSGSTLLYQLLAVRFRTCYFSNGMMRFPDSPAIVARLTAPFGACTPRPDFDSWYGNVAGESGPSQGFKAWNRWFPTDLDFVDPDTLSPAAVDEMRRTIWSLQRTFDAPFISKWQRHAARVQALAHVFPEAVFVRMTRDPVALAESILHGRREFLGDEHAWLSVRPRAYSESSGESPLEQVCEQVFHLEREVEFDLEHAAPGRHIRVDYADLCADTGRELTRIDHWYRDLAGQPLHVRHEVPRHFARSAAKKVDEVTRESIRTRLEELRALHASPGHGR